MGPLGSLPRATTSFHDLGLGALPGRHVVLRAPSSAEMFDALERADGDLDAGERRRLQRDHRRHRQAAVCLHEVRHTLGAMHERSEDSLMFPQYRPRMTSFGPESGRVMRVVLAARDARTPPEQATSFRISSRRCGVCRRPCDLRSRAEAAPRGARPREGRKTAEPLFAAYADVRTVQEFRCSLATSVFRFEVARRECDRLMANGVSLSP